MGLYLRDLWFICPEKGRETVDEGAEKFAPLIAFGVNQELLLSGESCCCWKRNCVEKYAMRERIKRKKKGA